jgi:nicotinamidase/pyrazinamidase
MSNVVIVVDMLKGFLDKGNLANQGAKWIVPNIEDLLKRKREQGWRIFFLADNHKKNDLEFLAFPEHCVMGSEETDIIDELSDFTTCSNYIPKTRYSGLFKTNLEWLLEYQKPEEIIVVGIYADICVLYTAAGLRNLDYKVTIPKDCTMTLTGMDSVIFDHMKNVLRVNIVEFQKKI